MQQFARIVHFRKNLTCYLLLVFQTAFTASCAMALSDAQLQYTRQVWQIQDGLPEDTVQAMQQTPDGYLWIGTTGGLARFDGSHFLTYRRNSTPAITENSVFCLLTARDGSLWLGTEGGGLLHFEHGHFRAYTAREGLTDGFVRSVIEDETGRLWVGTDNGLFRIRNGIVQRVDTSRFAPSLAIHSIFEDHEHRIWAGGSRLLMFDGEEVRQFRLPGAYSQNRVKSILQTSDGTVWVGTVGGLQRLSHGLFAAVPGIAATVRALRQTADGTLWIGTIGQGLYTFARNELHRVSGNSLLPSNTVLNIYEDATHQIWLGTQDGLVRLSRTPVKVIPLPGGSDPDFETISYDNEGTIWAVSSRVYAIRHDRAVPHIFSAIADIPVRNVFRDREGTLWIGTDGSGAWHLTAHGPVHYSAPQRLANNFVRAFLQSRDGSVWIATDEGVSRIAAGRVNTFRVRDGLVYFSTRALMEDRDGNLWIGTDQGLSCWSNHRFIHNAATRALIQEKIWTVLQDAGGVIWFGTRDHGMFRYRDGHVTQFTTAQGLASNSVYQLLEDRHGQLWVSSPNTISSIPLSALDADSSDQELHLAVTSYAMPYAADGAQMYGGRQPSGCIGKDGGVWFPSSKGAVYIFPLPAPHWDAPRLLLTGIAVDGREIPASTFHSLAADNSRLEFAFAPLSLRSQVDIRYRYRLEPFDRAWTYAGNNRTATYTNLPAGSYQFRVVAFPLNDPAASSEAFLIFRKEPHFYATWWFLSLCLTLLCLISLAAYRWRMRLLQLRFKAVLEERGRLAREMHDTVIQGCTSVSALLEAISSLERENDALQGELLDFARTQMRTTINEARHAVWNLRHGDEPQQDISQAASILAEHTSREFGIAVASRSHGSPFPVPNSIAHEILMVVREAVYNAVLHGKPAHIWIECVYGPDGLEAKVRDDGAGFDPPTIPSDGQPHYGITGMRERVQHLNGRIEWISSPGDGTMVRFTVPRSALFPAQVNVEA
jgi:ligand-binding sensor domain-containing protein/signal transduction histidine kinase